ncbi:MAG: hypothetical protein ACLSHM_01195 [Vescimonas sp.]
MKINLTCLDKNGYADATTSGQFDICLRRTASDSWVPHSSLKELFYPYADRDYALVWTDEKVISMIDDVLLCLDETERQSKYDELFSIFVSRPIRYRSIIRPRLFAVNGNKVSGFEVGVNNYVLLEWGKLERKWAEQEEKI